MRIINIDGIFIQLIFEIELLNAFHGIKITDAVKEVKESLDKEINELKPKLDTLKSLVNEITTELYKNAASQSGSDQQNAGANNQQEQNNTQQNSESSSTDESKN